jgi:hypothetical protein
MLPLCSLFVNSLFWLEAAVASFFFAGSKSPVSTTPPLPVCPDSAQVQ